MTETNLSLARELVDAFNAGGINALREYAQQDVEFVEPAVLERPVPHVSRGVDAVAAAWGAFEDAWESHRSEVTEMRPLDDHRVLVLSVEHLTGRDGMEVASPAGSIITFREGKVARWETFWDRASALAAAGLESHGA